MYEHKISLQGSMERATVEMDALSHDGWEIVSVNFEFNRLNNGHVFCVLARRKKGKKK